MIEIYAGPVRSGKTTALGARFAGTPARGVLAPDLDGRRHVRSLATGETRALQTDASPEPVRVGRFTFDGRAFAWARAEIEAACAARPAVVVVDEVGPLELAGGGLEPAVGRAVALGRRGPTRVVLVVREGLVDAVRLRYGLDEATAPTVWHEPAGEDG